MKSGLSYRIEQDRKNKKATGIAAKKFTTRVSKKKKKTSDVAQTCRRQKKGNTTMTTNAIRIGSDWCASNHWVIQAFGRGGGALPYRREKCLAARDLTKRHNQMQAGLSPPGG